MGKYDDYTMGAIGMEGSNNWPSQWTEKCDESFKEYKKQIDAGKKVDENSFLDKQKVIFSKSIGINPKVSLVKIKYLFISRLTLN